VIHRVADIETEVSGTRGIDPSPCWQIGRVNAIRVALVALLATATLSLPAVTASAANPNRTVALTPLAANSMALMGAYPAAIGQTLGGERRFVSGLRSTKVLTLSHPLGPTPDELALLAPRMVYTSPQWSKGRPFMEQLTGGSSRVVNADPKTVQGVYGTIRQIARNFNRRARGERLVKRIKGQVRKSRRGLQRKRKVRVMVILGVNRTPSVFLGNSWGGQMVKLAGGRLLTGGARSSGGFARIGDDVVVNAKPDVIIGVPHSRSENIPDSIDYLKTNPAWRSTPAFRNKRVYISKNNSLLQAGTDIGKTIKTIRKKYLKNG